MKSKDKLKIIELKSIPEYYLKEKFGSKQNTVRLTDDWTEQRWKLFNQSKFIRIINTDTKEFFIRKISDKTIYKNLAIISWIDKPEK